MPHELMPCEPERDGMVRLPTQRTTKSIDIEMFCRRQIVNRKGEMKERILQGNSPRTVGWPIPFHQPAAI